MFRKILEREKFRKILEREKAAAANNYQSQENNIINEIK